MPLRNYPGTWLFVCELVFHGMAVRGAATVRDDSAVCGTVTTVEGHTISLKEGIPLSEAEFAKVHIMKMKNALLSPAEGSCQIKVCGFTSFTSRFNQKYLGSGSDYGDCYTVKGRNESAPGYIFNDLFNTSSITCGCKASNDDCILNCLQRRDIWTSEQNASEGGCAILYQENDCKSCHFREISLNQETTFESDNAHHIRSLVVRDGCRVTQNVTGLTRLWHFKDANPVTVYNQTDRNNIRSAFQSDPETFTCTCKPVPVTEKPAVFDAPVDYTLPIFISLNVTGIAVICAVIVGVTCWKHRKVNIIQNKTYITTEVVPVSGNEVALSVSEILALPLDVRFQNSRHHVKLGDILGSGHFGDVYRGTLDVAVKTAKHAGDGTDLRSLQQEIKILSYMGSHQNVVRLIGVCQDTGENGLPLGGLYLITEFCENGCLKSYLVTKVRDALRDLQLQQVLRLMDISDDGYAEDSSGSEIEGVLSSATGVNTAPTVLDSRTLLQFMKWCEQIANGMQYITSRRIVHVDLAARNILLGHNLIAKIGDFGLAKKIYIKDYVDSRKDSIPIRWVAPESLIGGKYSTKSDVWSYSITLWEIFTLGKTPYEDKGFVGEIISALLDGERLSAPKLAPPSVYAKMCECWASCPDDRPAFTSLRNFFADEVNQLVAKLKAEHSANGDGIANCVENALYMD